MRDEFKVLKMDAGAAQAFPSEWFDFRAKVPESQPLKTHFPVKNFRNIERFPFLERIPNSGQQITRLPGILRTIGGMAGLTIRPLVHLPLSRCSHSISRGQ